MHLLLKGILILNFLFIPSSKYLCCYLCCVCDKAESAMDAAFCSFMNPTGTKFSGDKIVPKSDLRAGTASDKIIKNEVNRIATWNVRSLGVRGKLDNIKNCE